MKNILSILSIVFIGILSPVFAQETSGNNQEGNKVVPLKDMESPWRQGKLRPSEVFLLDFLSNSTREIGQVATCSPKEAQIMWHCTVSMALEWKKVSKDDEFQMSENMEKYIKNFIVRSTQANYERYLSEKESGKFTCKEAVEIRKMSPMFDICEVKEN
jgi:hypothetical protein